MHETEVPASEGERGRRTGDGVVRVHKGGEGEVGLSMVHGVIAGRARLQRGEPLFPANRINSPRLSLAIGRVQPFSRRLFFIDKLSESMHMVR